MAVMEVTSSSNIHWGTLCIRGRGVGRGDVRGVVKVWEALAQ